VAVGGCDGAAAVPVERRNTLRQRRCWRDAFKPVPDLFGWYKGNIAVLYMVCEHIPSNGVSYLTEARTLWQELTLLGPLKIVRPPPTLHARPLGHSPNGHVAARGAARPHHLQFVYG
jgi:hypothetical protein